LLSTSSRIGGADIEPPVVETNTYFLVQEHFHGEMFIAWLAWKIDGRCGIVILLLDGFPLFEGRKRPVARLVARSGGPSG
jgi:hypothetical protein